MARTTSAGLDTQVAKPGIEPVDLIDIFFGSQTADDASTLHFCMSGVDVNFFNIDGGAQLYTAVGIKRSEVTNSIDAEQRQMTLQIDNIDRTFQAFFFQNADFIRDKRVVLRTIDRNVVASEADAVRIIDGFIDQVRMSEKWMQVELHGVVGGLTYRTGRHIDRICPLLFAGALCAKGVTASLLTQLSNDTAASGSTKSAIKAAVLSQPDDYWDIGTIKFTTGANAGILRKVIGWVNSTKTITPDFEFPNTPAIGDQFEIKRDCDKTFNECKNRYTEVDPINGNTPNFHGFNTVVHSVNP